MNWELIDDNVHNGLKKYIGDNPDDPEGVLVKVEQSAASVEAVIDANKAAQNEDFDKRSDMWHAAHVPIGVMYEWKKKYNVDCWKYSSCPETRKRVNALLNSSDYRYLRVRHFMI